MFKMVKILYSVSNYEIKSKILHLTTKLNGKIVNFIILLVIKYRKQENFNCYLMLEKYSRA